MTNQEWKQRSAERILKAVRKAGKIKIRDLERATHYNRGPADEGTALWFQALEFLAKKNLVVIERKRLFAMIDGDEELGLAYQSVMTPEFAAAAPSVQESPRSLLAQALGR